MTRHWTFPLRPGWRTRFLARVIFRLIRRRGPDLLPLLSRTLVRRPAGLKGTGNRSVTIVYGPGRQLIIPYGTVGCEPIAPGKEFSPTDTTVPSTESFKTDDPMLIPDATRI
jgi:hypothetical protein